MNQQNNNAQSAPQPHPAPQTQPQAHPQPAPQTQATPQGATRPTPQQNYPYTYQHNPYAPQPQMQQTHYPQMQQPYMNTLLHKMSYSTASGNNTLPYVVMQVTLKEKFVGTGTGNLIELESVINNQVALGYRLHTISTATSHSQGFLGGDRIQATLVFERLVMR